MAVVAYEMNLVNLCPFQHITASICGGIYVRVNSIFYYVNDVNFTSAISSFDEFLVSIIDGNRVAYLEDVFFIIPDIERLFHCLGLSVKATK